MILVLNDICPQNIFIGGPWGPGALAPQILTAVLGGGGRPQNFPKYIISWKFI